MNQIVMMIADRMLRPPLLDRAPGSASIPALVIKLSLTDRGGKHPRSGRSHRIEARAIVGSLEFDRLPRRRPGADPGPCIA
ncbi:MAG: hypothetical protein H6807_00710 [Planctomycetes bacterium]|nr:hypothetical protein [Planctomycetota bacterium]